MKISPEFDPRYIVRHPYRQITADEYHMDSSYRIVREKGLNDHLLILTLSGGGIALGERLGENTLYLFHPGERHDYGTDPSIGKWHFLWAHIHAPAYASSLLDWRKIDLRAIPCPELRRIVAIFKDAVRNASTGNGIDEALAMNLVENALLRIARFRAKIDSVEFADKVRDYILRHLDGNLDVAALARRFRLSPSRFSHKFRDVFATSPGAYVEECRLAAAKTLLLSTPMAIKEIALSIGFSDPLYFTRRFTRKYALSPKSWRESNDARKFSNLDD